MRTGIVIPAFNVAPYIGDAIRSVLAQTHQDWVAIVVDDGSTDDTAAIVAACADPRPRLIRQSNAGVSAARNRGLDAIDVEAVMFLDADDWLSPEALTRLVAALQADADAIAAVGTYTKVPGFRPTRRPPSGHLLDRLLVRNLFANGGHLLIRRTALAAAGPWHEGLRYGEDWEYWIRLALLGCFAPAPSPDPLLFVRERDGGAYRGMAAHPDSFTPCMDAIFASPALRARLDVHSLARLRGRAQAENDWIVGRELIRHGRVSEGRCFLRRSFRAAPGPKRLALLAAASGPITRIGPFRRYPVPDPA